MADEKRFAESLRHSLLAWDRVLDDLAEDGQDRAVLDLLPLLAGRLGDLAGVFARDGLAGLAQGADALRGQCLAFVDDAADLHVDDDLETNESRFSDGLDTLGRSLRTRA